MSKKVHFFKKTGPQSIFYGILYNPDQKPSCCEMTELATNPLCRTNPSSSFY